MSLDHSVTFKLEGEVTARLSVFYRGLDFFFTEEEVIPGCGWETTRLERSADQNEIERLFDSRCDWYEYMGCVADATSPLCE